MKLRCEVIICDFHNEFDNHNLISDTSTEDIENEE